MTHICRCIPIILVLFAVPAMAGASPSLSPKTLFVSGITDETRNAEWDDLLIAQGLASLVEEEMFKTGYFIPLEHNDEIQTRVKHLLEYAWHAPDGEGRPRHILDTEKSITSDFTISGVVKRFKKKRKRMFAGPFSKGKVTISLTVELFLKEKGRLICSGEGTGRGVTAANSFLFQIRQDKIQFDKTSVGKAAQQAIQDAVKELVKTYETAY